MKSNFGYQNNPRDEILNSDKNKPGDENKIRDQISADIEGDFKA